MQLKELQKIVQKTVDANLVHPFNGGKMKLKIEYHVYKDRKTNKIVAMVFEKDGCLLINLKLTPEHVDEMIQVSGVERGYHMNKKHWITVDVNQTDVTKAELIKMLQESAAIISG